MAYQINSPWEREATAREGGRERRREGEPESVVATGLSDRN